MINDEMKLKIRVKGTQFVSKYVFHLSSNVLHKHLRETQKVKDEIFNITKFF